MVGYEVSYINSSSEYIDHEGPFFTSQEVKKACLEWLEQDIMNKVELCKNEYLGTKEDYDFNDCFFRRVYNKEMFLDSFL